MFVWCIQALFVKLIMLSLAKFVCKWWWSFAEHHFSWSRSYSGNVHSSWTAPYILVQLCILIHFFEIDSENDKVKNVSHAWIRTTVRYAVGLHESVLDHSVTTYCICIPEMCSSDYSYMTLGSALDCTTLGSALYCTTLRPALLSLYCTTLGSVL